MKKLFFLLKLVSNQGIPMRKDILDEDQIKKAENYQILKKVVLVIIVVVLAYWGAYYLAKLLPRFIIESGTLLIKTDGVFLLIIIVTSSIVLADTLHKYPPQLSYFKIALYTGCSIFISDYIFCVSMNPSSTSQYFLFSLFPAYRFSISGIAALIANIRVHYLRDKELKYAIIYLVLFWFKWKGRNKLN